jgi:hypothetical protein
MYLSFKGLSFYQYLLQISREPLQNPKRQHKLLKYRIPLLLILQPNFQNVPNFKLNFYHKNPPEKKINDLPKKVTKEKNCILISYSEKEPPLFLLL